MRGARRAEIVIALGLVCAVVAACDAAQTPAISAPNGGPDATAAGAVRTFGPAASDVPTGSPRAGSAGTRSAGSRVAGAGAMPGVTAATLSLRLPYALSRTVAIADGSGILVLGGLTRSGTTARILRLDLPGGAIVPAGDLPSPVHDAAGAILGPSRLVVGGGGAVAEALVQRVGPDGSTSLAGLLPAPRADLAAVASGAGLVVAGGGMSGRADPRVLASTDGTHFRTIARLTVAVRYAAAVALGNLVYVVGGSSDHGDVATIQAVDPAGGTARIVGRLPWPLAHATAFVVAGAIYVAGGEDGGRSLDTILRFDPASGRTSVVGHLPGPRSDAAVAVVGRTAYLIGGEAIGLLDSIVGVAVNAS